MRWFQVKLHVVALGRTYFRLSLTRLRYMDVMVACHVTYVAQVAYTEQSAYKSYFAYR